jgi:hypothetical protein
VRTTGATLSTTGAKLSTTGAMLLCLLAALIAWRTAAANPLPESGELLCERAYLGECNYSDDVSGLQFVWQSDWPVRRLKIHTSTGPAARARQRDALRWISLEYVPDDEGQAEVSLFRVAVLQRADWLAQSARPWPTAGVEVATNPIYVAVAFVPPANPYPPGSRDADIFDALLPGFAQISRIVRFPSSLRR